MRVCFICNWKWCIGFSKFDCWGVYFFFHFCQFLLHVFWWSVIRCVYVCNCYLLMCWYFYHDVIPFCVSSKLFLTGKITLFCLRQWARDQSQNFWNQFMVPAALVALSMLKHTVLLSTHPLWQCRWSGRPWSRGKGAGTCPYGASQSGCSEGSLGRWRLSSASSFLSPHQTGSALQWRHYQ